MEINGVKIAPHFLKYKLEKDFLFFIRYMFYEVYGQKFIVNWHHIEMVRFVMGLESHEIPNGVINIPPRHTKTEIIVIMWMAWTFARNPKARFIHVSYNDELALRNSGYVKEIISHPCFQQFWQVTMKATTDAKKLWETTAGGGVKAGAAGGPITGFGAGQMTWEPGEPFDGAILIDDPLKADDAGSQVERDKVNRRLTGTLKSRRNHRRVPIVIVMQRLHEEDASGFALSGAVGLKFEHLKFSALQEDGTALWPHMHTVEELEAMKLVDRSTFASQYQQEPAPIEGAVYKLSECGRFSQPPVGSVVRIVHSWDTAYKPKEHNDPSVCTIWHETTTMSYLVEVVWGRWDYPELRRRALELADRDKPHAILIEDKASGQSLIQEFQQFTRHPIIALHPDGDKETRARTTAAMTSRIMLPNEAPWLLDYETEMQLFPNAKNDDRVDSTSQYLKWLRDNGGDTDYNALMDKIYSGQTERWRGGSLNG